MDPALKHRLIGAAVLSALAIIFLPMLIVGRDRNSAAADVPLTMPNAPDGEFQTRELPLVTPASSVPDGGVVGMDASHPPAPAGAAPIPDPDAPPPAPAASVAGATPMPASTAGTVPVPAAASSVGATPTMAPASAVSTAAAAALPIPAASAGGHYVVSLGTYANAANAQALVASLKGAQLPAYAESVAVGGKPQMRVRIGPFQQRGDAEAARLKAQELRKDMPAQVTALDNAAPVATPVAPPKPVPTTTPAPPKPVPPKPAVTIAPAPAKPAAIAATPPASGMAPVAAPAAHGFVVQVSAFAAEEPALALRNKLRAAGFTAFSERVQAESGTRYRVRVGPTADHAAADRLRTELSTKLGLSGMVVAYP